VGRFLALLGVILLCCGLAATAVAGKKRPNQRVTLFSDSSGASLNWDSTAKRIVERGNRVRLELHPCGRLTLPGCLTGNPPPSVLATVRDLGHALGPNVVIFVGYNDDPATYRHGLPIVAKALWRRGVQHMIWLTLHAVTKQYVDTNHAIYAEQQKWGPTMTVLDWNHYSGSHSSWYASDGIHMTGTGAIAFATYLHSQLKKLGLTGPKPKPLNSRRSPAGAGLRLELAAAFSQLLLGAEHEVAQVHALKPSASGSGADGVPITWLLESIRSISSDVLRFADAPLTVALSKTGEVRSGSAAKPAFVPRMRGVSSIHSAVAWVELYGMVCDNVSFRVTSWSVITQTFEFGTVSAIAACM
jgi:hypothetical protein